MRVFKSFFHLFIAHSRTYLALRNRFLFPRIAIGPGVEIQNMGTFSYGKSCSVGRDTNISIAKTGALELQDHVYLGRHLEVGADGVIAIGRKTTIQDRCILLGEIEIGADSILAPNVYISSGRHYFKLHPEMLIRHQDDLVRETPELSAKHHQKIKIGEDCWIGIGVVIMPGITIGRGAVVGAHAVVNADLPPYSIAAGSPARKIGERLKFEPPAALRWNEPEHRPYFYSGFSDGGEGAAASKNKEYLIAKSQFSICLKEEGGDKQIKLVAQAATEGVTVTHGGVTKPIATNFGETSFNAVASATGTYDFFVAHGSLLVREARFE